MTEPTAESIQSWEYQSPDDGQSIMFRRPQHAAQPVVEGGHLSGFAHVAIFSVDVPSVGVWEEGL